MLAAASTFACLFSLRVCAQQTAPLTPVVVQPSAPGKPTRTLPPTTRATLPPASPADAQFMQGMIMHHAQAVEMTALIESHTENKSLRSLGARISRSQSDEIKFMKRWLVSRGQPISEAMPGMYHMKMPDMDHTKTSQESTKAANATPDQKKAEEDPFAPEPAPPLPAGMTGSDANDPRAKLKPGLFDAGETSLGMNHLLLLKKPDAFQLDFDPNNPKVQKTLSLLGIADPSKMPKPMQLVIAQLAFANSDLAFQGHHLFQGNFYGVNIYDISNPAKAQLLTSMICPGGQGDVSVYKNLMFMSVEQPNGRLDCGTQAFQPPPPPA